MNTFEKIIQTIERYVVFALVAFMALVLIISTIEIGIIIDVNDLTVIFGFFLTVLIGLELYETVTLYLKENVFHGEVILLVSLIAVSRKVIVIDYTK